MTGFKKWLNTMFGFSRTESNAFIILLPLVVIIVFSEPAYRLYLSNREDDFSAEKKMLDSLTSHWQPVEDQNTIHALQKNSAVLFPFNPNKATVNELQRLGVPDKVGARIIKYCKRGGNFRIKSDLQKIYGIDSTLYQNLYPYILLPTTLIAQQNASKSITKSHDSKPSLTFDLNKADTTQLKSIDGIGSTLANRVIKYRDKIGGFISTAQLNEVYGLDTVVVAKLLKSGYLTENFEPTKININTATQVQLEAHPYIKRPAAKAIVAYRFQHGNFKRVEELSLLHQVKNVEKIMPYLAVE